MGKWSPEAGLNRRPRSYQERALPLSYLGLAWRKAGNSLAGNSVVGKAAAGRARPIGELRTSGELPPGWILPLGCRQVAGVMVEGAGFEPAKPFRTPDLQSGGFNHSPTPPFRKTPEPPGKCRGGPAGTTRNRPPAANTSPAAATAPEPARRSGRGPVKLYWSPRGDSNPYLSITNRLRYHCATGAAEPGGRLPRRRPASTIRQPDVSHRK